MNEYSPGRDLKDWYDTLPARWGGYYASGNQHFIRRIENVHLLAEDLGPECEVLDIGCATGEITASIHERFGCRTVGIDFAKNMVEHCMKTYRAEGLRFEVGDILNLPFPDDRFNLVVSMSVIEWVEDYTRSISEVSRVLKPGGQWIVSIPNWMSLTRKLEYLKSLISPNSYLELQKNRVSPVEFRRIASLDGFETVKTIYHVFPYHYENITGRLGQLLGAMCMLSLKKAK